MVHRIIAIMLVLSTQTAQAALINYQMSGTITDITQPGISSIALNDNWSANLTVLSASSDQSLNQTQGLYIVDWSGTITIGSKVIDISGDDPFSSDISTRVGLTTVPEIEMVVSTAVQLFLDQQQIHNFGFTLFNTQTLSLTTDSFYETANFLLNPPIDSSLFTVFFSNFGQINGVITSFDATLVPIPSALILLLSGLAPLAIQAYRPNK